MLCMHTLAPLLTCELLEFGGHHVRESFRKAAEISGLAILSDPCSATSSEIGVVPVRPAPLFGRTESRTISLR